MVNEHNILPLTLREITVKRRGKHILGPVSLTLQGKGISVVVGPNGSGKTTLLRAMHGLDRISAGHKAWGRQRCGRHMWRNLSSFRRRS